MTSEPPTYTQHSHNMLFSPGGNEMGFFRFGTNWVLMWCFLFFFGARFLMIVEKVMGEWE